MNSTSSSTSSSRRWGGLPGWVQGGLTSFPRQCGNAVVEDCAYGYEYGGGGLVGTFERVQAAIQHGPKRDELDGFGAGADGGRRGKPGDSCTGRGESILPAEVAVVKS